VLESIKRRSEIPCVFGNSYYSNTCSPALWLPKRFIP
jgi:hypothetical protein